MHGRRKLATCPLKDVIGATHSKYFSRTKSHNHMVCSQSPSKSWTTGLYKPPIYDHWHLVVTKLVRVCFSITVNKRFVYEQLMIELELSLSNREQFEDH